MRIESVLRTLLPSIGIKIDVVVYLAPRTSSILFLAILYAPAFADPQDATADAIENSGAAHNTLMQNFRASNLLLGWIWRADSKLLMRLSDGFGCYIGLFALFAVVCKSHPFTWFIHSSATEASNYTTNDEGVPSTTDWKEECEAGGHLVSWVGEDV